MIPNGKLILKYDFFLVWSFLSLHGGLHDDNYVAYIEICCYVL